MGCRTLYISDMDGTLLNRESKVSAQSAAMLREIVEQHNIMFTVATARTPATVVPLMRDTGIRLPLLVMTGAAQWSLTKNDYTHTDSLSVDAARRILTICDQLQLHPFIYERVGNKLHVQHAPEFRASERAFYEERCHSPYKQFILTDNIIPTAPVMTFMQDRYEVVEQAYNVINKWEDVNAVFYRDLFDSTIGLMEVFSAETSKANAIRRLAKEVQAERVVVFGDNRNDLSMMSIADTSVAVGNAIEEVKAVADIIIGDNITDSVPRFILSQI